MTSDYWCNSTGLDWIPSQSASCTRRDTEGHSKESSPNRGSSTMGLYRGLACCSTLCDHRHKYLDILILTSTNEVSSGFISTSRCKLNRSSSWLLREGIEIPCVAPEWLQTVLRMMARIESPQASVSESRLMIKQVAPSPFPKPDALLSKVKLLSSGEVALHVRSVYNGPLLQLAGSRRAEWLRHSDSGAQTFDTSDAIQSSCWSRTSCLMYSAYRERG